MDEKNQIEKERWDIARIMSQNFHINDVGWDESDFEWTAHCLQMEDYHKQEWISVDERLPKEGVRVLVWLKGDSSSYTSIDTDRLSLKKWVRWGRLVTHWMPLPEPPKMKGGAE